MRFSIRDLLWVTLVVAVCCGWWFDHTRMQREMQRRLVIQGLGGITDWDPALDKSPTALYFKNRKP